MRRRKRAILIRTMPISKAGAGGGAGALGPGHGTADGPAAITGGVSSAKGSSHSPAKAVVSSQRAAGDGGLGGAGGSSVFQMCHCCESLACYCGCESECLRALCARVGRRARHARQNPGEGSGTRAAQGLPERAGNPGSEAAPDACWATLGLLVCLADSLSDLWLAASFSYAGETRWFALTLFFVLAPSLVVQAVSFRWAAQDLLEVDSRPGLALGTTTRLHVPGRVCRACVWLCQVLLHALQLGQAWRYVRVAYLCARCRRVDGAHLGWALRCELADAARLRLLGAFLQCGPQLVLQLCIMLQRTRTDGTQAMATAVSLLALSWALAAYNKALRDARDDKATMGLARAALQLTWRACTIFSRVVSFALFASIFQVYFGIFVVAHWYLVTFWVIYGGTDFCTSKWEEILFNLAVGVVYIFCWLSVHEGQTCGRMLAYYGLVAAENLTLTLAWFMYRHTASTASFAIPAVLAVVGSFAAGMSCALVYYGLAHPSGRRFRGLPSSCCSEVLDGVPLPPAAQAQQQTTPVVASGDEGLGQPGLGDSDVCPHTWRPSEPLAPVPTTPLPDAAVIRVDMPRKRYPAWEAHHIDRRLRSAIVGLQTSALRAVPSLTTAATVAPVVRYRDGAIYELIEYETTV